MRGTVVSEAGDEVFWVAVQIGGTRREILAICARRLLQKDIRIVPGDPVEVEVSTNDPTRGRIVRGLRRES